MVLETAEALNQDHVIVVFTTGNTSAPHQMKHTHTKMGDNDKTSRMNHGQMKI